MKQILSLNGYDIEVFFEAHCVHITNNLELWQLIGTSPEAATTALVRLIFTEFARLQGREFDIHPDSLKIEIWGHVYFEYWH